MKYNVVLLMDEAMQHLSHRDRSIEQNIVARANAGIVQARCHHVDDFVDAAANADAILLQCSWLGREVIDRLDRCKVIAIYGIGVDAVDISAATQRGIYVTNVPDCSIEEVSNHALALLMSCHRRIPYLQSTVRDGRWDYNLARPTHRLQGSTLGLVGFGKIARRLAAKARGLGMRVLAHDPFVQQSDSLPGEASMVAMQELLAQSDFVSVHVPLNAQTRHLLGAREFGQIKKSALLINTSRGPVVDERALIDALRNGQIAGAGLDVLYTEPIEEGNPLLRMQNVVITPHSGWYSEEAEREKQKKAAECVVEALEGQIPKYLVNTELAQ
jgi:D-3-phosphoglycerate dehydrogenase / 2-oxoglutarate reductase